MLGLEHFEVVELHFKSWGLLVHSDRWGNWILFARCLVIWCVYYLVVHSVKVGWWAHRCALLELRSTSWCWFWHGPFAGVFAAVHLLRNRIGHSRRPDELPSIYPWVFKLLSDLFLLASTFVFAVVYFINLLFCQLSFLEFFFKVFYSIFRYFWHKIACFLFLE